LDVKSRNLLHYFENKEIFASREDRDRTRGVGFEDREREREKIGHVFINALCFKPQNASSYQKCPIIREEDVSIMRDHRSKEFVHPNPKQVCGLAPLSKPT
jgi:hypothetical protein